MGQLHVPRLIMSRRGVPHRRRTALTASDFNTTNAQYVQVAIGF